MREKLIELFYENNVRCDQKIEGLADDVMDIIANGVTIQKWIPVTERLPGICDTVLVCYDFMGGKAVRISDRYGKNGMLWSGLPNGQRPTHWMPLPEPPKGE